MNRGWKILCQGAGFRLEGMVNIGWLYLRVTASDNNESLRKYQTKLRSLHERPNFPQNFDQIQDLLTHLHTPQNLRVDLPSKKLQVLTTTGTKTTVIGQLPLKQCEVSDVDIIDEIIFQCRKERDCGPGEIRKMVLGIGEVLRGVLGKVVEGGRDDGGDGEREGIGRRKGMFVESEEKEEGSGTNQDSVDQIRKIYDKKIFALQRSLAQLNKKIQSLTSSLTPLSSSHISQSPKPLSKQKPTKNLLQLLDPLSKCYPDLKISGSEITVEQGLWGAYIFGKKSIGVRSMFTVRVVRCREYMGVGVGDCGARDREVRGCDYQVLYDSRKKLHTAGSVVSDLGQGFKPGQTIKIIIHKSSQQILWKVNNQIRYSHRYPQLSNPDIQWVPLIHLPNVNDCIQWIQ